MGADALGCTPPIRMDALATHGDRDGCTPPIRMDALAMHGDRDGCAERRGLVQRVPFPDPTAFGKGGRPLEGVKWRVSFFWHVEHVVPASMCAHKFCMTERLAKNKAEGRLRELRSISESMYVQLRVATPPL